MAETPIAEFDATALYAALNEKRLELGLSWSGAAKAMWDLSHELNSRRHDHPISPATLSGLALRGDTSCQHAAFMCRWLNRAPESFLVGAAPSTSDALPDVPADRRLRWDLKKLFDALDAQRRERALTWAELASDLRCTPHQLSGLRRAKFAMSMNLAMRTVQWLHRPSSDFLYASRG